MLNKNNEFILWLLVAASIVLSAIGAMPIAAAYAGSLSVVGMAARLLFACIHGNETVGITIRTGAGSDNLASISGSSSSSWKFRAFTAASS